MSSAEDCTICSEPLAVPGASLTRCGHVFHTACLEKWFDQKPLFDSGLGGGYAVRRSRMDYKVEERDATVRTENADMLFRRFGPGLVVPGAHPTCTRSYRRTKSQDSPGRRCPRLPMRLHSMRFLSEAPPRCAARTRPHLPTYAHTP